MSSLRYYNNIEFLRFLSHLRSIAQHEQRSTLSLDCYFREFNGISIIRIREFNYISIILHAINIRAARHEGRTHRVLPTQPTHYNILSHKREKCDTSCERICDVYGANAVSVRVAQNRLKRSQSGNFDVKDEPRSGRPVTDKVDVILKKVKQDRHISSCYVAEELGIDHKTVLTQLKKAGYIKKLDTWVPHELTERNLMNRLLICDSLLKRKETESFLKRLITCDEKWITTTTEYSTNYRETRINS
ncbi:Histone-lysine N-methyltransferase SETMAR [Eumeta japonica]|uniref:Histone-lysine N-methyltransferase SETMAR n=1 Tax=Eumeta variegata TaxID=151549 RepID=A0A4C1Y2B8_EUMVA|nr:Histone-lysine N-methyltransferase SETMAR [Eumeta japonica]